ncbi:alkaline phosphatase family protein (plasmid) [Polymorphobacter sp. PAMC 29334]|uniref:alkaline phosphatase family protein n=1 Tax=Polymorphobacter sp. PAMC 29334 TaxID=2862331 RepID=UPI001C7858D9|nr:alkaline phosphatase family protein [Polymorphobacter sp. PAMC 29334]QYE33109.1 alkaline phosphatase family protein [Polymorphobacter sp. PAMC 29334]
MIISIIAAVIAAAAGATIIDRAVPSYDHVYVIIEENKDYKQIMDENAAPNISRLAATYGTATQFYAEVHPSEANYVALLGGDTYGIHDDDAFYCRPGPSDDPKCAGSTGPGYVDHTIRQPHLGTQLEASGRDWKGYYETLPAPGSTVVTAGDPTATNGLKTAALYASKHSGFINFASVQADPQRARHIVGFDQLEMDIAADRLPAFALIVPNQCNEMHGLHGDGVPADCDGSHDLAGLIRRGDTEAGQLVAALQATKSWTSRENVAIIIGFDEGAGRTREGCCGVTPGAISNFGGGHIPMVVITNHGPRSVSDSTPYSHYSLLRTLEDAFRLPAYLGHAADTAAGVVPMTPLFAVDVAKR